MKGDKDIGKKSLQKNLTIEVHHNKHSIEDQGCSWAIPLKNCLNAVFQWCLIRPHIFWEIRRFEKSKRMEIKK
jgi:hypothetical protein